MGKSFIGGIKESNNLSSTVFVVLTTRTLILFTTNLAIRPLISNAKINAKNIILSSSKLNPNTPFEKTNLI